MNSELKLDELLFRRMFRIIGVPYTGQPYSEANWFQKYSWTAAQEEKFKSWLFGYFVTHRCRWREFSTLPRLNKANFERTYAWFNLNYGFKGGIL